METTELVQLRSERADLGLELSGAERQAEGRNSSRVNNLRSRMAALASRIDGLTYLSAGTA
jgi:hypothetical protein